MGKNFINGQGLKPYADIKFGFLTFKHNGCGPIAVYNLLLCLNQKASLEKIIYDTKFFFTFFSRRTFRHHCIRSWLLLKKRGSKNQSRAFSVREKAEGYLKKHGCGILLYFHGRGSHYVAVQHGKYNDDKFTIYNRSSNYPFETNAESLEFLYRKSKIFIPLLLFVPITLS